MDRPLSVCVEGPAGRTHQGALATFYDGGAIHRVVDRKTSPSIDGSGSLSIEAHLALADEGITSG